MIFNDGCDIHIQMYRCMHQMHVTFHTERSKFVGLMDLRFLIKVPTTYERAYHCGHKFQETVLWTYDFAVQEGKNWHYLVRNQNYAARPFESLKNQLTLCE